MKITIDPELRGKELYRFLRDNKQALINQKKSRDKFCDAVTFTTQLFNYKEAKAEKTSIGEISSDATVLRVKTVANTSLFIDSDMDLLLRDNAKKSMKERKGLILHLKDHGRTLEDEIGDVQDIYYEDISLRELGYDKNGSAQALIFETDIKREYDAKTFDKYRKGKIKQHSIGLRYGKLELAINDPEDEKEYDFWNKYIKEAINPEVAEEKGYFWVVPEIILIENSAVLFGSNKLTPTISVEEKNDTDDQPPVGTEKQPSIINWSLDEAIKQVKIIV